MSAETFGFPFTPYDVQVEFMNALIETLEDGKIGIFESPTGTGKSLSLLCGSLTWLKEHQKKVRNELEIQATFQSTKSTTDDWVAEQSKWKIQKQEAAKAKRMLQKLNELQRRGQEWRCNRRKRKREDDAEGELRELLKTVKQNMQGFGNNVETDEDDEELILDYESEEESNTEDEEESGMTRIFYCSRTHSQLSQFIQEVKRSNFCNDVRLVSLASRENLCVNELVRRLKSISLINERCLEMQKKSGSTLKKCSYKKESKLDAFSNFIMSEVQDIEELAKNGQRSKTCPYYSTRLAAQQAELIVLPYNTLLHSGTRASSGLKLKDSVVIIDEAHNLMETIANVHTVILTGKQVSQANTQLNQYFIRYQRRLSPQNLLYVKQLLFVLNGFLKHLVKDVSGELKENVVTPLEFLTQSGADNINIFKLLRYCDKSHVSHKLHGFSMRHGCNVNEKTTTQSKLTSYLQKLDGANFVNEENEEPIKEGSPFISVQELLRALSSSDKDGRVIYKQDSNISNVFVKFLLLNPSAHFQSIVSDVRALLLAGGTMHPHSEFIDRLLLPSGVKRDRIRQFSCDHVVPKENLLALTLSKGPSRKRELDFTYGSRGNADLIEEVGRLILNLSMLVPGGMVVFFPSYDYEQFVYSCWERTGLLLRLNGRKRVFREPRKSSQTEEVLANYAKCILSPKAPQNGAILLSIVGGKMSEGINFSDSLGRCVVMIGLPFPNVHSIDFKEKSAYLDANLGSGVANSYGHLLCMRAVNQSIGRAIRHRADYAIIVLMDLRYQKPSVQSALPLWIRKSLQNCDDIGPALASVKKFFAFHNQSQN